MNLAHIRLFAVETLREATRSPNFQPLLKSSFERGAMLLKGQLDHHEPCKHCECKGFVRKVPPNVVKEYGQRP